MVNCGCSMAIGFIDDHRRKRPQHNRSHKPLARSKQESVVRENRMLRLTRRGLETWQGRDHVTLADERASNREHQLRPKPARQSSTLPMSGMWKRSHGSAIWASTDERVGNGDVQPTATAPHLDSTRGRGEPNQIRRNPALFFMQVAASLAQPVAPAVPCCKSSLFG